MATILAPIRRHAVSLAAIPSEPILVYQKSRFRPHFARFQISLVLQLGFALSTEPKLLFA